MSSPGGKHIEELPSQQPPMGEHEIRAFRAERGFEAIKELQKLSYKSLITVVRLPEVTRKM